MQQRIAQDFSQNKTAVIEMLISNVMNVNVEIPKVVRGEFEEEEENN